MSHGRTVHPVLRNERSPRVHLRIQCRQPRSSLLREPRSHDPCLAPRLRWSHRQVRPVPPARLASRRNGRTYHCVRTYPRRNHGQGGSVPCRKGLPPVPPRPQCDARRRSHRRSHRILRGHHGNEQHEHQESPGLLDPVPARLHVPVSRSRRIPHGIRHFC